MNELLQTATMLERQAADYFPVDGSGKVHFIRGVMEAAAESIRAALKNAAPQGLSQPAEAKAESEAQRLHLQGAAGQSSGEAPADAASDRAELIRYWKTFQAPSNEVAAAEVIEKLDRELAKADAALDAAGAPLNSDWEGVPTKLSRRGRIAALQRELERLNKLINTPELQDFDSGVRLECAHQVERWGEAHDRSKSAENWYWLVGYLAGKALRAAVTDDREKALHHTISAAAALRQWHAAIKCDTTGAGIGEDPDLVALDGGVDPSALK